MNGDGGGYKCFSCAAATFEQMITLTVDHCKISFSRKNLDVGFFQLTMLFGRICARLPDYTIDFRVNVAQDLNRDQ